MNAAVYRVVAVDNAVYFLKLRKVFHEVLVAVPLFLATKHIQEIIIPLKNKFKENWSDFGEYKMILYPFIEGKNGFEIELSHHHKQRLGSALRAIHGATISKELKTLIPKEDFSSQHRNALKNFLTQIEQQNFHEPIAAKLVDFIKSKRDEIKQLIENAERLASALKQKDLELVLCHSDIHGGNILISEADKLYIVDWDAPLLAPKERDLMFIGGGIDRIWKSVVDQEIFFKGYGTTTLNLAALAYYRHERIIVDMVELCTQLLVSNEGGADREQAYQCFLRNFEPGNTLEKAYELLTTMGQKMPQRNRLTDR